MSSIWSKLINLAGNITGVLPTANGGTALSTIGTANQVLGVNSGATGLEYKTLAVGTAGTDFAVANAANSVTFNLPDAAAAARGAVTTGTQTMAGAKTWNDVQTFKYSSGATTAGLYDTNGSWFFTNTASNTLTLKKTSGASLAVWADTTGSSNVWYLDNSSGSLRVIDNAGTGVNASITQAGLCTWGQSGGTQVHVVNGTLNATVGVKLPTSGGTATTLNYYEEIAYNNVVFTPNISTANTATVNCKVTRTGDFVSLFIPAVLCTTSTSDAVITSSTFMDSRIYPTTQQGFVMGVAKSGGTVGASPLFIRVNTDGSVSLFRDATAALNFTTGSSGLNSAITVTWKRA